MPPRAPIITLTSDFGMADGTVGAMIGVIKSICPVAEVVVTAADVPPHDISRGAWALLQSAPFFPPGCIHVAVVDPGVGSGRRGLLVQTERDSFLGPDNGVLTWVLRGPTNVTYRELTNRSYRLASAGVTFDGRDLFAAAAAHLAAGADPSAFGPTIDDPVRLEWPDPVVRDERVLGIVLVSDQFGNLITNVPFEQVAGLFGDAELVVSVGTITAIPIVPSYSHIREEYGAVVNGTGLLEIAAHRGSAAARTGLQRGAAVIIAPREAVP